MFELLFFFYKSFNSFVLYNMKVILVLWETEGFCPYCTNIRHVVSVFGRRVNSSKKNLRSQNKITGGGGNFMLFHFTVRRKMFAATKVGMGAQDPPPDAASLNIIAISKSRNNNYCSQSRKNDISSNYQLLLHVYFG